MDTPEEPKDAANGQAEPAQPVLAMVRHRFTKENARAMQLRSAQARKENGGSEGPKRGEDEQNPLKDPDFVRGQVEQAESNLALLSKAFKKAKTPRDALFYAQATAKLFEVWSLLTGHERPAVALPKIKRKASIPFPQSPPPEA